MAFDTVLFAVLMTLSILLLMPSKMVETELFAASNPVVTVVLTLFTALEMFVLIASHFEESVLDTFSMMEPVFSFTFSHAVDMVVCIPSATVLTVV